MHGPFDKAHEQLEKALDDGELTDEEFREEERNLRYEQQDAAREAADEAYDDIMGR